jgi:hypothetical protein
MMENQDKKTRPRRLSPRPSHTRGGLGRLINILYIKTFCNKKKVFVNLFAFNDLNSFF